MTEFVDSSGVKIIDRDMGGIGLAMPISIADFDWGVWTRLVKDCIMEDFAGVRAGSAHTCRKMAERFFVLLDGC